MCLFIFRAVSSLKSRKIFLRKFWKKLFCHIEGISFIFRGFQNPHILQSPFGIQHRHLHREAWEVCCAGGLLDGGMDGNQNGPSIFLFQDILNIFSICIYICISYICSNIKEKLSWTSGLWFIKFGQVEGPDGKIQNHPLGLIFFHTKCVK